MSLSIRYLLLLRLSILYLVDGSAGQIFERQEKVNNDQPMSSIIARLRKYENEDEQQQNDIDDPRIIGGTPAVDGDFPFFAHTIEPILCGATLIHPDILLTAAHCQGGFLAGTIVSGIMLNGSDGIRVDVDAEIIHPNYDDVTRENDIMLVKLNTPINDVPLVTLNTDLDIPALDEEVTVIGHGNTIPDVQSTSDVLLEVNVNNFDDSVCDNLFASYIPETMICAGTTEGGRDSCQGDSGGPLMRADNVQVGLVSAGLGCGDAQFPAVYTEVAAFQLFIRDTICEQSDVPPASCNETAVPTTSPGATSAPTPQSSITAPPTGSLNPPCFICMDGGVSTITIPDAVFELGGTPATCDEIRLAGEVQRVIPEALCQQLDLIELRVTCGCENVLTAAPTSTPGTTFAPTVPVPGTSSPTNLPTSVGPGTSSPTTPTVTTSAPTTPTVTTSAPTTPTVTTSTPTTPTATTSAPTTPTVTTSAPTTPTVTTSSPTILQPTELPTLAPTALPTATTMPPTSVSTPLPTTVPTEAPTIAPTISPSIITGGSYCTDAPDYQCYIDGWPQCCFIDPDSCPTERPDCDYPPGALYCTNAPDYTCYIDGWPQCCLIDPRTCPDNPPDCDDLPGSSYCTYAPDYDCYLNGWPECCFIDFDSCPVDQPGCDNIPGSSYCTDAPNYKCYLKGWPSCCIYNSLVCPDEKPKCELPCPSSKSGKGKTSSKSAKSSSKLSYSGSKGKGKGKGGAKVKGTSCSKGKGNCKWAKSSKRNKGESKSSLSSRMDHFYAFMKINTADIDHP